MSEITGMYVFSCHQPNFAGSNSRRLVYLLYAHTPNNVILVMLFGCNSLHDNTYAFTHDRYHHHDMRCIIPDQRHLLTQDAAVSATLHEKVSAIQRGLQGPDGDSGGAARQHAGRVHPLLRELRAGVSRQCLPAVRHQTGESWGRGRLPGSGSAGTGWVRSNFSHRSVTVTQSTCPGCSGQVMRCVTESELWRQTVSYTPLSDQLWTICMEFGNSATNFDRHAESCPTATEMPNRRNCLHYFRTACTAA